ncbi:6227_t:CDS:2, partial [Acaulospora colombiana]
NELYLNTELIPVEEFFSSQTRTWTSWVVSKLLSPISLGIQMITGSNNYNYPTKWIVVEALKEASDRVLQHQEKYAIHGITDNLFTMKTFKAEFSSVAIPNSELSDLDLKQKVMAKYCLRQKKHLEQVVSKRLESLETVEGILSKIQGAASDTEIIEVYNVGANTLKNIFESSGLTADSVEATMDKLQEVFADQREIDDAMKLGDSLLDMTIGQEEELDKELEELLMDEDVIKEFQGKLHLEPLATKEPDEVLFSTAEQEKLLIQSDEEEPYRERTAIPL